MIDLDSLIERGYESRRVPVPYGEPRPLVDAFHSAVKETHGIVDQLVSELDAAAETKDWDRFDNLLVLARVVPDPLMRPAMRAGIYGTIDRGPLVEDIISLIVDIEIENGDVDEGSIPALRHAVYAYPDWDAGARWATKKALDALGGMRTPEAVAIVADIARNGAGEERDHAQDLHAHILRRSADNQPSTNQAAIDDLPLKEYVGYIWIGEDPGIRLSVWARGAAEAGALVEEEYGEGHPYSIWNEADANKPR